ncbi:WLM-domain-containing protein [Punctularia strigosozonata HHB-11173 SS5]|uniref:WLM-domain-containing protein n=1 Tax=Punctularia strigosozonata (strain HHB-11173) TaxID=741275 RepID=UPI00044173BD|nr:WLM-domain-containing protein [Punctularia strigosozonata HHB-11173 SS5]EIN09691.1 WLM-domain-containing protein [Punctularia strigosozonata HHB-11173 SS5]
MVHIRLNERESNPNPHINFITALPTSSPSQEDAMQLLRALAAQVKPVMKAHGFMINSFEEYEYNAVFAGRSWNNGETVEIVLRRPDGSFYPSSWLMSTLCHELAHIKHMNHGPAFQALWARLRNEVRALQAKGYFGDGFWSSGTRLADAARTSGQGLDPGELPEYMCGGAQTRARPTRRKRRPRAIAGPSDRTGAQTTKRRKAGSRVAKDFGSGGRALNDDLDEDAKKRGTGFGKQARSKKARDERAAAIERRLAALKTGSGPSRPNRDNDDPTTDSESESEELIPETDAERRNALLDSLKQAEPGGIEKTQMKSKNLLDYWGHFVRLDSAPHGEGKRTQEKADSFAIPFDYNDVPGGNVAGPSPRTATAIAPEEEDDAEWQCAVCTLRNNPGHLACSACATPRGESSWQGGSV